MEGSGAVEFADNEDVGTGGISVDSEMPVPVEYVYDMLVPLLLEIG